MTDTPHDDSPTSRVPRWPRRLQTLSEQQAAAESDESRRRVRDRMWVLIHTGLFTYLRSHSHRMGLHPEDELHDLATEKSLELLDRISAGKWKLDHLEPLMIVAYFSRVARNCLLDWNRAKKRDRSVAEAAGIRESHEVEQTSPATPHDRLERKEFARELKLCVESLSPRSRLIWLLRVFGGRSTREIACNPRIDLKPGHVDVLMQRIRGQIRGCMSRKGFDTAVLPAGCFVEMLRSFDLKKSLPELEVDDE